MKHPALTRIMAIALVVLCLTMAGAGALGLGQARKDLRLAREDMERLHVRIKEYRSLSAELEDRESYESLSGRLDERQQAYDRDSSAHRGELGTFTATQYGLDVGLKGIDEAEALFASYKGQFENALAIFQNGMDQTDTLLAYLWTLYDTASPMLDETEGHIRRARAISAVMESGEELTRAQAVEAFDALLAMADASAEMGETLRALEPTLDALAAFDLGPITAMADAAESIRDTLGAFGDLPMEGYADFDVGVDFDMNRITEIKQSYDTGWAEVKRGLARYDEASAEAAARLKALTGMEPAELRARAQAERDALAAREDGPLDPAEAMAVRAAWQSVREPLLSGLDETEAGLAELRGSVGEVHTVLVTVQTQLAAFRPMLAKARELIAAAETAMYEARAMIWQQMGKQREKEEELWESKDRLDSEALALQELSDEAETQKSGEQRQRTLRMNLMSRDGIRERVDAGEELGAASEAFLEETLNAAEEGFARRRTACLLMLFAAPYSLIALPAAFESAKSRLLLVLPPLHCLGCAAGAEQILWKLGRGLSYSCLAVMAFAFLLLLVSRPGRKRKRI